MSLLLVENLCTGYGKTNVVNDISLSVEAGQMVGLLGPNGCGKSTFIKALCKGVPFAGTAFIEDLDLRKLSEKELAKRCTYVPQRSGLSIDITVFEVVLMGFHPYLGILQSPGEEMKAKVREILTLVGLGEMMSANFMELSEGQKRLCILARSLVTDAKLLIMDEPDAALDFGVRHALLRLVSVRIREQRNGVLLAMHDTNLALSYCDIIYLMKQGRIVGSIKPGEDSRESMEEKLSDLYGPVRLLSYDRKDGKKGIVMV